MADRPNKPLAAIIDPLDITRFGELATNASPLRRGGLRLPPCREDNVDRIFAFACSALIRNFIRKRRAAHGCGIAYRQSGLAYPSLRKAPNLSLPVQETSRVEI